MNQPSDFRPPVQKGLAARAAGTRVCGARYILKRKLGRGGWSEVWLAQDVKRESEVALKVLPGAVLHDASLLQKLEQETSRNAQLAHPAIARIFDFVSDHEVAVISMEYIAGWPLEALKIDKPEKRFRVDEIMLWVYQLCAALDYAHHNFCLVHRELKPSNLLLNGQEQLKVTDFGIAHLVRSAAARQGTVLPGAIPYMSPQQIGGAEPSILDDIYAVGASIFDLVTGTPPFAEAEVEAHLLQLPAPSMSARLAQLGIVDSIPTAWDKTVAACLEKEPGKRPQSASDVLRGLEQKSTGPLPVIANTPAAATPEPRPVADAPAIGSPGNARGWVRFLRGNWFHLAQCQLQIALGRIIVLIQQRPKLLFTVIMALALFNLALGLFFLLRH